MSQLVGKSAEERNAALVMLDILASTKNKSAAEVAGEVVTARVGQEGLEASTRVTELTSD